MIENRGAMGPSDDGRGSDAFDPEADLPEVVARLEELGASDRQAIGTRFVDRAMLRTQSLLSAGDRSTRRTPTLVSRNDRPWSIVGGGSWSGLLRLAAVVALMAGGGALWVAMRPAPVQPANAVIPDPSAALTRVALDVDLLDGGPWSGDLDHEIAVLLAESAMLGGEIEGDVGDLLDEGAM